MPKQTVKYPSAYVYDDKGKLVDEGKPSAVLPVPEGGHVTHDPGLEIVWTREPGGYVQVVADYSVDQLKEIVKGIENGHIPVFEDRVTLHLDMSRYQINQTIKTLRRARDAAYGKDE